MAATSVTASPPRSSPTPATSASPSFLCATARQKCSSSRTGVFTCSRCIGRPTATTPPPPMPSTSPNPSLDPSLLQPGASLHEVIAGRPVSITDRPIYCFFPGKGCVPLADLLLTHKEALTHLSPSASRKPSSESTGSKPTAPSPPTGTILPTSPCPSTAPSCPTSSSPTTPSATTSTS